MISTTNSIIPTDFPIMSILAGNFAAYEEKLIKHQSILMGQAGEQLRNGTSIILEFPAAPSKQDFEFDDVTGTPLYPKYQRDITSFIFDTAPTAAPIPSTPINDIRMANLSALTMLSFTSHGIPIPSTTTGNSTIGTTTTATTAATVDQYNDRYWQRPPKDSAISMFDKHRVEYRTTLNELIASDNKLLEFLIATHTSESLTAIQASTLNKEYPPNCTDKSLRFWKASKAVHQIGTGSMKFKRTSQLFQLSMGDQSHATYMNTVTLAHNTLNSDFAELIHGRYMIDTNHLMSLVYLGGLDTEFFRFKIDRVLEQYSDGRIADTAALLRSFHKYVIDHGQNIGSTDSTARALVATTTAATTTTTAAAATTAKAGKYHCTICLALGYRPRGHRHDTVDCPGNTANTTNKYDKVYHDKVIDFAKRGFIKGTFGKSTSTPQAHVTSASAITTPVGPTGGIYDTDPYKRASAYAASCPVGTAEWLDACAAVTNIVTPGANNNA